jgi:hypothetical protein
MPKKGDALDFLLGESPRRSNLVAVAVHVRDGKERLKGEF